MPEVTASVEKIQKKQAKNGDVYTTINLNGQKKVFFDWEGHCEVAGITEGDTVRVEHDGSGFPRITDLEKVGYSESTETNGDKHQESKSKRAVRMCALVCAALVMHGSNPPEREITGLASKLEKWIAG